MCTHILKVNQNNSSPEIRRLLTRCNSTNLNPTKNSIKPLLIFPFIEEFFQKEKINETDYSFFAGTHLLPALLINHERISGFENIGEFLACTH